MKILVTGADGMLGRDLMAALAPNHEAVGTDVGTLDVTRFDEVAERFRRERPDVVIHCAAMTDVDGCETRVDDAMRVNTIGAKNVAVACRHIDAAVVHVSTDYVFSGLKGAPYTEWESGDPTSVYGRSKWAGEVAVRESGARATIVRTSGLYGKHGKNFVATILKAARERGELRVVSDQITLTTYTRDLAKALVHLAEVGCYGTFHVTNGGPGMSWFDWTGAIMRAAGLDHVKLTPITAAELSRPAARPPHSVLDNLAWRLHGWTPLRTCEEALAAYLAEIAPA